MKKGTIHIFLVLSFLFLSCSGHGKLKEITIEEGFSRHYQSRSPEEEVLRLHKDSVTSVAVIDDMLCLFDNHRKRTNSPTVRISEISNPNKYKEFIPCGVEAGQMAMPFLSSSEGKALFYDPLLKRIATLNPREAYDSDNYEPLFKSTQIMSQRVMPFGDRVLYINSFSFDGKEPRILFTGKDWMGKEREYEGTYLNVMSGNIFSDNRMERIGCAMKAFPTIEIMDRKGKPLIKITFPHEPWKILTLHHDGFDEYIMDGDFNDCFYAGCGGESLFCVVYDDKDSQLVLVFDWEGNILDGFELEGKADRISLSKDEKSLYIWEHSGEDDVLNRYSLKNNR